MGLHLRIRTKPNVRVNRALCTFPSAARTKPKSPPKERSTIAGRIVSWQRTLGRVRKRLPRMFYRYLTHGGLVREKDRIPFEWCFRTQTLRNYQLLRRFIKAKCLVDFQHRTLCRNAFLTAPSYREMQLLTGSSYWEQEKLSARYFACALSLWVLWPINSLTRVDNAICTIKKR